MLCRKCGSKMDLIQRTTEGNKVILRYVCPKATCQETALFIRGDDAASSEAAVQNRWVN